MNKPNIYPDENPPPYSLHPNQNDNLNFSDNSISSQNVASQNVTSQNVPSQNMPAQNVPSQNVPSQNVPAQDVLSQNIPTQNYLPQQFPPQYFPPQQYPQQTIPPQYIIIPPQVGNSNLPNYQSTVMSNNQNEPNVMTSNNFDLCPYCRSGTLIPRFTFFGLLLAIFLFPFGIVCLFILMKKHCTNCKVSFSVF